MFKVTCETITRSGMQVGTPPSIITVTDETTGFSVTVNNNQCSQHKARDAAYAALEMLIEDLSQ